MKQAMKRMKNMLGGKKGDSMHQTMVLITIGGWLLTGTAFAVDGGEKIGSSAGTMESQAFNVLMISMTPTTSVALTSSTGSSKEMSVRWRSSPATAAHRSRPAGSAPPRPQPTNWDPL
jgi:hypothetical protein